MKSDHDLNPVPIVGIGVSVLDTLLSVDQFPHEEQVVQAKSRAAGLGGGVAVAMATASSLGVKTLLVDRLGTDVASRAIIESLAQAGVDTRLIDRSEASTASIASIWVTSSSGSRTIVFSPGNDIEATWASEIETAVADATVLHLNGRHREVATRAIEVAKATGTRVSYDGGAHRYRSEIRPLVCQADILIVARQFAQAYLDDSSAAPIDLCRRLRKQTNAELAGVTCGTEGSWFETKDGSSWHQPAFPVENVVDTTGCGDVFHGAFLAGLVRGDSFQCCGELAARAAALNASQWGAFGRALSLQLGDV
ncbi:5-dehydro-2-deoxygluconokinase [Rubripirellula amarantea]|uniref:5-dehydro-2-deoxygluconokinase n=1 Tax=Rubripirellula amarantea TaxID=2527999 RepID=A0A5C5WRM3_9BACT|nr:carbohydrate kinase family protein [Rubripirellula amarantea]TWT53554.1 5-dehydro-2-deoxygluconokinase [Rubripirellula amarantea]